MPSSPSRDRVCRAWGPSRPGLLDFTGAVQVAQIRRTRTVAGKRSVEVVYDEDRSCERAGRAPRVMAILRSTAIGVLRLTGATSIAAATRQHARNPARPVELLMTC